MESFKKPKKKQKTKKLISLHMRFFSREGNSFQWDTASRVKKNSSSCCRIAHLSLSTVNISVSSISSTVLDYGKGNITLHHRNRRRADSVVTMKAFRPRRKTEFSIRQSFQRKYLGGNRKVLSQKYLDVSIATSFWEACFSRFVFCFVFVNAKI